jgi:RNA polymerase sigma factor (sigma-70 family)
MPHLDEAARNELAKRYWPLLYAVAEEFRSAYKAAGFAEDEVISAGAEGMARAINRFDPRRRTRFSTFARPAIRGAIRRDLKIVRPKPTGIDVTAVADHRQPPLPGAEPLFGCLPHVPPDFVDRNGRRSVCPHAGDAPCRPFVCMRCHRTAFDSHPALQITASDRIPPNRRPKPGAPPPIPRLGAMRDRRMKQFSRAS